MQWSRMLRVPSTRTWLLLAAGLFLAAASSCAEPAEVQARSGGADAGPGDGDDTGDDGDGGDEQMTSVCNRDGTCGGEENCMNCSADCGICEVCKAADACDAADACTVCPDVCDGCQPQCEEPQSPAVDPNPNHPPEGHNAGLTCLTCHTDALEIAPPFVLAGTLYTDVAGTAPRSGATIVITDANGAEFKIVTSGNGNFWSKDESIAFPITMRASSCPDVEEMPASAGEGVAADKLGNCNSCHTGVVDEAAGTVGRIELPL